MKRIGLVSLLVIAAVSLCLVGAEYTMTIGHSQPETSARHKALLFFPGDRREGVRRGH